ncbi:Fe-S cluster assembly protein SufD [Methylonatrum kenyense]|uniref:Fe-S cluster assembly protein SufD n=1 Tax=Methylonatrum kenyense TaxID=455253 RepID=UPI0020BDC9F7|nr:Fe-S cluster assembly protein SufD [Methylonatrum kenyense]MCK8514899.1 Fe-S cluster assembly protein SufD [Methylonatrum kenyense]
MEAVTELKSAYMEIFEAAAQAGGMLGERRRQAIDSFERLGFPTRRMEAWKHAKLDPLTRQVFPPAAPGGELSPAVVSRFADVAGAVRLVFVDGHFSSRHSDLSAAPAGVRVQSLDAALREDTDLVREQFARVVDVDGHAFAALNTAFSADGAVIDIADNVVMDAPVVVIFASSSQLAGHAAYPRILLRAGQGSEVRLVQQHLGDVDDTHLVAPVTELVLRDNSGVSLQHFQDDGPGAWHLGAISARVPRDARFALHTVSAGSRFARTDVQVDLVEPGADLRMNGLYMVDGKRYADYHTVVRHVTDHSQSQQLFKGILGGRGEAVFDGTIHVARDAQQTDSEQQNSNLLLNPMALAHSNPRLEIYADDVKCAHGSTVGELDEDAMFYLRSRGIGLDDAQALLTFAFANEVLDDMIEPALSGQARQRLLALLPGGASLEALE